MEPTALERGFVMSNTPEYWRSIVIDALGRLVRNDGRGFEDTLWLGLGDSWWPLRQALIRKGLIEAGPHDTYPRLTQQGMAYLERTRRSWQERTRA